MHGLEIIEEDMVNLEEMMLQEEVGENKGGTDVEDTRDRRERNGDGDVEAFFYGSKY